jgi:hypothetical protein
MARLLVSCVLSVVLGLVLMSPLGLLFERMHWPAFHSWGLMHGSFLIAWPALSLAAFLGLYPIPPIHHVDLREGVILTIGAVLGFFLLLEIFDPAVPGFEASWILLAVLSADLRCSAACRPVCGWFLLLSHGRLSPSPGSWSRLSAG